jgi:uncharacterized protein (TIGR00369 family)
VAEAAHPWDELAREHIWTTLGYREAPAEDGRVAIAWDAPLAYTFPTGERSIVHGGMVATILDSAMGMACFRTLGEHELFLTADLHVDFYRSALPGLLRAEGEIVHRTRSAVFCAATLTDADGRLLAAARCTQVIRARR